MKKLFALILSLLFFATVTFAVVGCKKKEEPKEEPTVTGTTAPAPEPAPAPGTTAPVTGTTAPVAPAAK